MSAKRRRVPVRVLLVLAAAFPVGLTVGALWRGGTGEESEATDVEARAGLASLATRSDSARPSPRPFTEDRGGLDLADGSGMTPETRSDGPVRRIGAESGAGQESSTGLPSGSRRSTPIVEAAARVAPSVVSITVLRTLSRNAPRSFFDEFWNWSPFPRQLERTVRGLGSGFAIDSEGYILTNEHVVGGADSIVVTDASGRLHQAQLVGADELTDIAVVKIPAGRVRPAPLGTSADLLVGEPAIAIGNPFGYLLSNAEATVTSGVISGVGRDIRSEEEGETLLADMVQTDASINPGNSGGPLVNADGQVIGVNSSIFSRSGGSEGLGFAIPIDRALRVADELREFGRIRRPYVGVDPVAIRSDTSLFSETRVRRVAAGSPADRAGLEEGDVLIAVAGRPISSPLDWEVGLLDAGVHQEVEVTFVRDGRVRRTTLRIEELPSQLAQRLEVVRGLELITVTPEIGIERGLGVDSGAMVVGITANNASVTGMRKGDVIWAINRRRVETAQDARDLFQYYAGRSSIRVNLYRDGKSYYTTFYVR